MPGKGPFNVSCKTLGSTSGKEPADVPSKKMTAGKRPIKFSERKPTSHVPNVGGKQLTHEFFQQHRKRLSLASSSSDSSDGLAGNSYDASNLRPSGSDSESSLTAMSEQDETAASRRGSVFFSNPRLTKSTKSAKSTRTARKLVAGKLFGKGKLLYAPADDYLHDDGSDDEHQLLVSDSDTSVDHGIYSIAADEFQASSLDDSETSPDESEVDDSQDDVSSSSSSDEEAIDFVQLQSERKRNGSTPTPSTKAKVLSDALQEKNKRKKSFLYRRRSSVAIPEDINFKFDFDDALSDTGTGPATRNQTSNQIKLEEEDLGEELVAGADTTAPLEFHFDQPLVEVPKFKDEELISDDDYDYDDNDLVATLQADNDFDEYINAANPVAPKTRQSSMSSFNEEDGEDAFLKEEEKYLVNEFETNGFDEDELDPARLETARMMSSFNELDNHLANPNGKVVQYESSDSKAYSDNDNDDIYYDDEEDDGDEYVDFIDFDRPFSEKHNTDMDHVLPIQSKEKCKTQKKLQPPKQKSKKRRAHDSEDEDDSYLWNYFFSSDAESSGESEADQYDADEQLVLEEIFRQNLEQRKQEMERESSMDPAGGPNGPEYEAGESTDEDQTLPSAEIGPAVGSKVAKEVLSSKTADYRPPVLGIWAAVDSKPFGIIDGLSTRTLNHQGGAKTKPKGWRSFSFKTGSDDLAIELEELLNISELDNDDENDVRIWRDFNNNKNHIPLGAFRNKAHISSLPSAAAEPIAGYSGSKLNGNYNAKRRYSSSQQLKAKLANKSSQAASSAGAASSSISKDLNLPSKLKLRRASIADAVSEGYRPTKAGLYSENVLADVEEILGEDRDLMALIKGIQ